MRYGCTLSPVLFNIYAEKIIKKKSKQEYISKDMCATLDMQATLISEPKEELLEILIRVKTASEDAGLSLNLSKMKVMAKTL